MKKTRLSRRRFLGSVVAGTAAMRARRAGAAPPAAPAPSLSTSNGQPALLGGQPVRTAPFPAWPVADTSEEKALADVLRSGEWFRVGGKYVDRFEAEYARLTGSPHCLATANGTSALVLSLQALGVGPGDEVIVPPYTFVATVNAVLLMHALPVFVDTDPETFQIDARKVEAAITERTRAIVPVHLGGSAADLDTILAVAGRRGVPVIEDACQAHLGEWRGKKLGTWGRTGCFSFQASKNLNSGEGGAILTADQALLEACYELHNNSRGRGQRGADFSYQGPGSNLRMTEFQGALLLAQMARLDAQAKRRDENAAYLTGLLNDIPGFRPARLHAGCTRNAYHIYMSRYDAAAFAGLPRAAFLKALRAEGIPVSPGYSPLNREPFLEKTFASRGWARIYTKEDLASWRARNQCPENDRLCGEAVWMGQTTLLGSRTDMDQIAEAVRKVQKHADRIAT
jgi:dTDP-4-amino-4,6-dideoxygalactose transaminase